MNRQALAFLTMFSLILMLSVYYVTLPSDTTSVLATENGEDLGEEEQDTSKEPVSEVEKLQDEINTKNDEEVKQHADVVSRSDSSEAQKQESLETIDALKEEKAKSEEIVNALKDADYMAAVEIVDGTCIVNVFECEDTMENAKAIMKILNEKIGNKYLLELTFK